MVVFNILQNLAAASSLPVTKLDIFGRYFEQVVGFDVRIWWGLAHIFLVAVGFWDLIHEVVNVVHTK